MDKNTFPNNTLPSETILNKIRKLLALSTSTNPHEAALATQKATELLLQYNLSMRDLEVEASPYHWHDMAFEQCGWKRSLIYGITKYNLCTLVISRREKSLHLVGKQHNLEVVLYLYHYLEREISRMAGEAFIQAQTTTPVRRWKTAFREGAVSEIVARLKHAHEATTDECRALIVVNTDELEKELHKRFKHAREISRTISSDAAAYAHGQAAGRSIPLHQGVERASQQTRQVK